MSTQELRLFVRILEDYTAHLEKHPDSLLAKIFGVFTVTVASMNPVHVMVMENTLKVNDHLEAIYDLKGSSVDRMSSSQTLKDMNWVKNNQRIYLNDAELIKHRIQSDV